MAPFARPSLLGRLLSINDRPIGSFEELVDRLEGLAPELVKITLETDGGTVTLAMRAVNEPAGDATFNEHGLDIRQEGAKLIARIFEFRAGETRATLEQALAAAGASLRLLVLDLRAAAGGDLGAAADVASLLLPEGTLIASLQPQKLAGGKLEATGSTSPPHLPIAILISPWTSSASEILTLALAGKAHVVTIGLPTRGKCIVQRIFELTDGEIAIPIAEAKGPAGERCHETGVLPEVIVPRMRLFEEDWLLSEALLMAEPPRFFQCRPAEPNTDRPTAMQFAQRAQQAASDARTNVVLLQGEATARSVRICLWAVLDRPGGQGGGGRRRRRWPLARNDRLVMEAACFSSPQP